MRLIQLEDESGNVRVGVVEEAGTRVRVLDGACSMWELARRAIAAGGSLEALAQSTPGAQSLDYAQLLGAGRVLTPLHHPDPAHCMISGTGLTHLGSAAARDAMHQKLRQQSEQGALTDSMRMFQWGVEGGTPAPGAAGVQPEWFYKGQGSIVAHPGATLDSPQFALDGGEEPELVGLYVIGPDGTPHRLGFAIGNEFSDHVTERSNYLYLAHSKLRACAVGPEVRTGPAPRDLRTSMTATKIIVDLERMGDQAKGIAKVIPHLVRQPLIERPYELKQMGDMVSRMLNQVLLAYSRANVDLARMIGQQDDEVDMLYAQVFSKIMMQMAHTNNPERIEASYEMLRVARELERFGDLATNIAERVVYLVTGTLEEINVDQEQR